jgi:hypothetical protein
MVERKVLGSNFLRFLDALTGVVIGPLSRVPNANRRDSHSLFTNVFSRQDLPAILDGLIRYSTICLLTVFADGANIFLVCGAKKT